MAASTLSMFEMSLGAAALQKFLQDRMAAMKCQQAKFANAEDSVQRCMSIHKVHVLNNGYSLKVFMDSKDSESHHIVPFLEQVAGQGGVATKVNDEETAQELIESMRYKDKMSGSARSVGSFDQAAHLLGKALALQGAPGKPTNTTNIMGQEAVSVFGLARRASAYKLKEAKLPADDESKVQE